ncbi:MAG: PilZN3 domain-containing protein [Alkalispirochaeta sp.]
MAVTTSQQISRYYEQFQTTDVTFTKEIIRALMLNTKQVFLKSLGYQWPCIIYSSSMTGAKIITTMQQSLKETLQKSKNTVSLRYSFIQREKTDPLAFFVSAKISGISPYGDPQKGLNFLNLTFTQRPPDDLIERLGNILEANIASQKRSEERIIITPDSAKKIGLASKGAQVVVDNIPRKGLIRDISFSGAKVIMPGIPQFLKGKKALLTLEFEDPSELLPVTGTIVRFETVEGRSDIAAFAICYDEDSVPMAYKMRLSNYLRPIKKPLNPAPSPSREEDNN